eukprot:TRINITY_DN2488_c0_g1_i2.p2 TRINITY_DN2488_c0_g1~~TRINITY_DN2488_c0_g1_i2.p2  ORF type:complete len:547 (+),score=191.14 TRINITY_DN2488_c0_g1_i2:31-1671(+)
MSGIKRPAGETDVSDARRRKIDGGVAEDDDANLDPVTLVKKLVAGVKAKMKENIKKRDQHGDQPDKFMESELALDEEIEKATLIAVNPAEYELAIKMGLVETLMQLTMHENNDILCSTMTLLSELTEGSIVSEDETAMCLHEELKKKAILGRLMSVLERLSGVSEDEKEGVLHVFSVLENLMETVPEIFSFEHDKKSCEQLAGFLLRNLLKNKELDEVKSYSAELLSSMLQTSPELGECFPNVMVDKTGLPVALQPEDRINGVHALLECLARYIKKRDASEEEEVEYVKDIYDCLAATLLSGKGKTAFREAQGFKLLFLLIQKKKKKTPGKFARGLQHVLKHSSLKCLVHAVQNNKEGCCDFVKDGGLGIIFSFMMMVLKNGTSEEQNEVEGHAVSAVLDLLRNLEGDDLMRAAAKFSENEYEKLDRAVELLGKSVVQLQTYDEAHSARESRISEPFKLSEEQHELERLENGYLIMQQVSTIVARLATYDKRFLQHLTTQLKLQSLSFSFVLKTLKEAASDSEDTYHAELHDKLVLKLNPVSKDEI